MAAELIRQQTITTTKHKQKTMEKFMMECLLTIGHDTYIYIYIQIESRQIDKQKVGMMGDVVEDVVVGFGGLS